MIKLGKQPLKQALKITDQKGKSSFEKKDILPMFGNKEYDKVFCRFSRKLLQKDTIVSNLERFQDFIVVSLCIGLFCVMLIRLGEMFLSLLKPLNFQAITSDILFILILVELFRLLIIYLQEKRISVGAAVEVSLVSALREVVLQGVLEIPLEQLLGICAFLGVLGGLIYLRVWMFEQFNFVNHIDSTEGGKDIKLDRDSSSARQYSFRLH